MTVKDFDGKGVPKDAKVLIGTREYGLKKVVHLNGNVYNASLMDGEEGFECRVSAEHEVLLPKPAPVSAPKKVEVKKK